MGLGATIGGYASVSLAQRLSRSFLRGAVLSWAIGLTIYAFWTYLDV
jgi:uncharacterized membrane protein YfcA